MSQSTSDILRKAIREELDQGADYFTTLKRDEFHKKFLKSHPDITCDRTLIVKIFKEIYEERGVDLYSVGLSRKKRYNVKLAEKIKQQHKEQTESTQPEQTFEPLPQVQYESVLHAIKNDQLTVQSTGALIRCFLSPLEAKYPEIKLEDDTIEQLGKMCLPSLQRYGSEMMQYFILPMLSTLTLLGTKAYTGYRIKKEKNLEIAIDRYQ